MGDAEPHGESTQPAPALREELLLQFFQAAPVMLGVVEVRGDEVFHLVDNEATARLFGRTPETMRNRSATELGAARSQVETWLERYRRSEALGAPVHFVAEQDSPTGRCWLSGIVNYIGRNAAGNARFSYVVEDITDRRAAELDRDTRVKELQERHEELVWKTRDLADVNEHLSAASHRFQELFQGLPVACFTFDNTGSIFDWNRESERLFGWRGSDVLFRTPWETVWAQNDPAQAQCLFEQVFSEGNLEPVEQTVTRPDGEVRHILMSTIAIRGGDGPVTGAICASLDITERKAAEEALERQICLVQEANVLLEEKTRELQELNARLEDLAITDGLTGLRNHRTFQQILEQEFQRASRYGHPLSVILLDVDRFKEFNDTFGHPSGDRVLKAVADAVAAVIREADMPFRYGGEEFTVVLPNTTSAEARTAAERIRRAVEAIGGFDRPITVSLGISSLSIAACSRSELVAQADAAMYRSKQNGRNRATHHLDFAPAEEAETLVGATCAV